MFNPERITEDYDARPIVKYDPIPKIEKLRRERQYIIRNDGKVAPLFQSKSPDPPWIYTRSHPALNCTLYNEVMFSTFGVFPEFCMDCWKVVVRPRTVKELILLLEIQKYKTKHFCKCGIEVREWVNANYGGYFYNRSKKEGLDCLDEVKRLVSQYISPDVPVFLKRYCTEFELKFGPSDEIEETLQRGWFMHPTEGKKTIMPQGEMQVWRQIIRQIFDITPEKVLCDCINQADCPECIDGLKAVPQPCFVRQHVIRRWFDFAWDRADMSVMEFYGGDPLYSPSVKYARN